MPQAFFIRKYRVPGDEPRKEVFKPAPYYLGHSRRPMLPIRLPKSRRSPKGMF